MVSKLNGFGVLNTYQNGDTHVNDKNKKVKDAVKIISQQSKVDALKKNIDLGNYKVDVKALAQKIADSLM